jgi:hypothetical protein
MEPLERRRQAAGTSTKNRQGSCPWTNVDLSRIEVLAIGDEVRPSSMP